MESKKSILSEMNKKCKNTLMETLNIEFTDFGENYLVAQMPVTTIVHQPDGILHGGATLALAESVGSAAAVLLYPKSNQAIRGIEISANHLFTIKDGLLIAKAKNIHKGKSTQLWLVEVKNEENRLISICKLTTLLLNP